MSSDKPRKKIQLVFFLKYALSMKKLGPRLQLRKLYTEKNKYLKKLGCCLNNWDPTKYKKSIFP